MLETEK